MRLAEHMSGRDNNLNLLRALAAACVVISHSYVLVTGSFDLEPLRATLGMSLGDLSVDVFFVISGLLVSGSLLRKNDLKSYLIARIRRIYPGLITMLLIVNIPVGLWLTSLPWSDYLTSPQLRGNFVHNTILVVSAWTGLPGVLSNAPWPNAINGSIWTLTYEIRLYLWLGVCWVISRLIRSKHFSVFTVLSVLTWFAAFVAFMMAAHGRGGNPIPRLVLFFSAGMAMYCFKDRIVLSWKWAALASLMLFASWFHEPLFRPFYGLLAPYLVVVLAYLPNGPIRTYNRLGDYSFGLYIYAFPIQQILVMYMPDTPPLLNAFLSLVVTLVPAILSWNLIEKRFLYR